ncbi:MAG: putative selenate ABC transporter substrate-binding protein [Planctomycetota bacterium]
MSPLIRPRKREGSALLLLFSLLLLPLSSCGSRASAKVPVLSFTAIPDQDTTGLAARFEPLAEHLSAELGVQVAFLPTADYAASVQAFVNGDVQLAWFGGLSGVQARARVEGARAIAQGRVDPEFKSYFIAHASTGLKRSTSFPDGLRGKSFTFGSAGSTSGRLMPEHFLMKATGETPESYFRGAPGFSGAHDKTAELVASGSFEAGAINYQTYDRMVREGAIDPETCRIVWETPTFPDYNFTAHPLLEERFGTGFIERLQQVLLDLADAELLLALERPEGLIASRNEDFAPIAERAADLGFLDH